MSHSRRTEPVVVAGASAATAASGRQDGSRADTAFACLVVMVSGAASLAWQGLWTQQLAVGLGHEFMAAIGVLVAIFAGLSAGAWWIGSVLKHRGRPGLWYAALEALIGLWGAALVLALPRLMPAMAPILGETPARGTQALFGFTVTVLALLPATVAMGATLPLVVRQVAQNQGPLALIYAANTAGAVLGVLAAVFWLVPATGLASTGAAIAALNLACAGLAAWRWGRTSVPRNDLPASMPTLSASPPQGGGRASPRILLAACGFLGIGHETLCVRVLGQVTENTAYSYAAMLAAFLAGTALGAGLLHRASRTAQPSAGSGPIRLLLITAAGLLMGAAALWWAQALSALPGAWFPGWSGAPLAGEVLAAVVVMGVPAMGMGALFAGACQWACDFGLPLGRAVAINTAGAAIAPPLVGLLLIPSVGPGGVAAFLVAGYLLLAAYLTAGSPRRALGLAAFAFLAAAAGLPALRHLELAPGEQVRWYREGVLASVVITEDVRGVLRLRINNRAQEGSSAAGLVEQRLSLLPLLLHPDPRRALFLGLGTGYTAQVAGLDPRLRVDAVELLPEVIEASSLFMRLPHAPRPERAPRLIAADARRFVLAGDSRYDLIVSDLFHPARSGAGSLYTEEHFQAIRHRLARGGIVCQWLALHQMELETFQHIAAAFRSVFPSAVMVLASNSLDSPVVGLLARPDEPLPGAVAVARRHAAATRSYAALLEASRLVDAFAVLGAIAAGPPEMDRLIADALPNRDDQPLVAHRAPWDTYSPRQQPRQRLAVLMNELQAGPDPQRAPIAWDGPDQVASMMAYWEARGRYLRLGLSLPPDLDARRAATLLVDPLRALLEQSPQFTPASDALATLRAAGAPPSPAPR
ncbi:MAG: spermidine synthase [Betaproteobacteria bacterium]|nr:spermidine synthase [Betaproteobacteria bacterium]